MIMHRQGDILFINREKLPDGLKQKGNNIIAEGEATGHAHALLDGQILIDEIRMFLNIERTTSITHQEHHEIVLGPGYWEVIRQREYTPETIRMVAD